MLIKQNDEQFSKQEFLELEKKLPIKETVVEENTGIFAFESLEDKDNVPLGYKWVPIRSQFDALGYDNCFALSRAKALIEWQKTAKFCGCCASKLENSPIETARICPNCGNIVYPRINPCIIVLVSKGDKILLARHAQRNQDIYACLAGFIEAGETVEQAVEREIMEETGLKVKNIKYYASQSWPFPSQLMMGFTAEWESGEIKVQKEEILEANWFDPNNCPASPQAGSVAYRLIHKC